MMMLLFRLLSLLWLLETEPDGDDADDEPDEDELEDTDDDEPVVIKNPKLKGVRDKKLKAIHDEAQGWRLKYRKAQKDIERLEAEGPAAETISALAASRIETAFWRSLASGEYAIKDHETAWDLLTTKGFADLIKVDEEGNVEGIDDAMDRLLDRYQFLSDDPIGNGDAQPLRRSASPPRKRRDGSAPSFGQSELERALPALRHGRRH